MKIRKLGIFQKPKIKRCLLKVYNTYWDFVAHLLGDKAFLKYTYRIRIGRRLNLDNPQSFNEKLNWLKLYDRRPIYTQMADKYEAKRIVASIIGEQYVVPCYGRWERFEDVDFAILPNQFVLKATGDSSGAIICKDKNTFNYEIAKKRLSNSLKCNYYYRTREWPYKNIHPTIIADKLLDDHTGNELRDYKFWCFNGEPKLMYCTIKGKNVFENFYDMDFNPVEINHGFPRHSPEFEKPQNFDLMKNLAKRLSANIPFVRIDFFNVEGQVYFGEFTFYDWAGLFKFQTYEMDLKIGQWLQLPNKYEQ